MFALFFDEALTKPTPYHSGGDYFSKAKDRMDRTFKLIAPSVRGSVVVDIGASPFYLLYQAKAAGARRCHGMYFSYDEHPLKDVERIYSSHGPIELSHANIETEKLPFGNHSVDIVTACEILEHCEHFPFLLAGEIKRVLKPGGLLCITVPNVCSIANIIKLIFQKNIYMKWRSDATGRHKHEFTHKQLNDFAEYMGLKIIKSGFFPSPTSALFYLRPIYQVIAALPGFKHYSPNLFVLAQQSSVPTAEIVGSPPASLYEATLSIED